MRHQRTLFDLGRVLRLTPTVGDSNGLEVFGRTGPDPVILRPFSTAGEPDISLYLYGLGTGLVYANGGVAESQNHRGAADGYCPLDSSTRVPFANLGTGTATGTKFLRDDRTWAVPPGTGGGGGGSGNSYFPGGWG